VTRGDIRIVKFPAPDKPRPVLVLTRASAVRALTRVTIAPVTSTVRGIPTEVVLTAADGMKHLCAVNLDNVTTVPKRLLARHVATLGPERMREVCAALAFATGCDGS
jgi:mRNA interferase MazF